MLTATVLVMLMSLPGLAIFYGGLAKAKDILNTIAMVFIGGEYRRRHATGGGLGV
jgi:Amt family ammonium transporter